MAVEVNRTYVLGDIRIEPEKRTLIRNDVSARLPKRPFQILFYLIENRGRVVTRQELLDSFWDGKDVYDDSLGKCIGAIRKALDDDSENPTFIETRYGEGYRYIGPAEEAYTPPLETIFEIERTRGISIVVEEGIPFAGVATLPARRSNLRNWKAAVALLLPVALIITALVAYNSVKKSAASIEGGPTRIRSIAVMPLKNLTGDPLEEYFAEGLTETMISELSRLDGVKVISRNSVFSLKDTNLDPREVGKRLGVASLLEGSVRKSGGTVRIDVRLISADDGSVVWAGDSFSRALKDILVVEDEIGCRVAAELRVRLCGESEPARRPTNNVAAYQAYLKGLYYLNKETAEDIARAHQNFARALELDPSYSDAWAKLGQSYLSSIWLIPADPRVATPKAKTAAEKALEIDDSSATAHQTMALVHWAEWDWRNCTREIQRAIALDSNLAGAHVLNAFDLIRLGDADEAWREIKLAEELDPLSLSVKGDVGNILYFSRRYDELVAYAGALPEDPNCLPQVGLGLAHMQQGRFENAIEEFREAGRILSGDWRRTEELACAYALANRTREAHLSFNELKKRAGREYIPASAFARVYAAFGKKEEAFKWLEKAIREHDFTIGNLNEEPRYDSLRADPRFAALLRQAGLVN